MACRSKCGAARNATESLDPSLKHWVDFMAAKDVVRRINPLNGLTRPKCILKLWTLGLEKVFALRST